MNTSESKVISVQEMRAERDRLVSEGKRLVFTNGCFDIIHRGHIAYLDFARSQGDALVVALNTDASVKSNKGDSRPVNCEEDRAYILSALRSVDYVMYFAEKEPKQILAEILPQVLVKGKDWSHYVSGREVVEANGGYVVLADMVEGRSTSSTIDRILKIYTEKRSPEMDRSCAEYLGSSETK